MTKVEMKALIKEVLAESMTLEVETGDFVDPNKRTLKVLFDKKCVAKVTFDISQKTEYEG